MKMLSLRKIFVGIGLSVMAIASAQYEKPADAIRLMTYNVMYCKGNEGTGAFLQQNINRIGQVIKYLDPDMITLQELDSACVNRNRRFLLDEIKKATGKNYQVIYGSATKYDGGTIGCGLLIKESFNVKKIKKIALPGDEARMLVRAELDDFFFMGTHLDLNNDKRIMSASMIEQELKYMRKPSFLGGDLNDSHRWNNLAFSVFLPTWSIVSSDDYTLSDASNKSTIDYLLYHDYQEQDKFEFIGTKVVKGQISVDGNIIDIAKASDHLPVYVDLRYKNGTSIDQINTSDLEIITHGERLLLNDRKSVFHSYRIFNIGGKCISVGRINGNEIDIQNIQKGLYVLELQGDSNKVCRKFIK